MSSSLPPTRRDRLHPLLHALVFSVILFVTWQLDPLHVRGYGPPANAIAPDLSSTVQTFDGFSNKDLLDTVRARANGSSTSAYMLVHGEPYYSQFGLQADVLSFVVRHGVPIGELDRVVGTVLRGLSALLLGAFLAWVYIKVSRFAAVFTLAYFTLADWPILAAGNLFWVNGVSLLVFVSPWLLFWRWGFNRRSIAAVLAIHVALVLFRSLFGYEYITSHILAPLPALAYYGLGRGLAGKWREITLTVAAVMAAGLVGFFGAIGAQVTKGVVGDGISASEGFARLAHRARSRTSFSTDDGALQQHEGLLKLSKVYQAMDRLHLSGPRGAIVFMAAYRTHDYLIAHTLTLPGFSIPLWVFLVALGAAAYGAWRMLPKLPDAEAEVLRGLAWATFAGALCALSWWAAFNHMMQHPHLNSILLYQEFMPVAVTFVAYALQLSVERRRLPATVS